MNLYIDKRMSRKNPYETLGVPEGTSIDQVKSAYKKLAMKHHPDKGGDPDMFKEINNAFGQIAKPEQFNQHNVGTNNRQGRGDTFDDFANQFFRGGGFSFFNQVHTRSQQSMKQMVDLRISLEELYHGKRVSINGMEVEIPANLPLFSKIPVPGIPVIIVLNPKKHSVFDIEKGTLNLIVKTSISLCEALLGFTGKIKHPSGETLVVSTSKETVIQHQSTLRVLGKGIPTHNGTSDLLMVFDVSLPLKFNSEKYDNVIKEMFGWDVPEIIKLPNDVIVDLV
jgi:DnaJ-class molecular chaperone